MSEATRYRVENGDHCIDVQISSIERLFDRRDPAPFRDRDLDPGLVEYLVDAGEDLFHEQHVRVVFWFDAACSQVEVEQAYKAHFESAIERSYRMRARERRIGEYGLLVAIATLIVLLTASQYVAKLVDGSVGAAIKEGLMISGWVVMWRPIETLFYGWIPVRHQRKVAAKLRDAKLDVRQSKGDSSRAPA